MLSAPVENSQIPYIIALRVSPIGIKLRIALDSAEKNMIEKHTISMLFALSLRDIAKA